MKKTKNGDVNEPEDADILEKLGSRVEKAISAIQDLRKERSALLSRAEKAEAQLAENEGAAGRVAELEAAASEFEAERTDVRNRIESILANLEKLDGLLERED